MLKSLKLMINYLWMYIHRIIYIVLFVALFLLAIKNTQIAYIDLYVFKLQQPIILLLFVSFSIGLLLGFMLSMPKLYRFKRQIKQHEQQLQQNTNNKISNNNLTKS